MISKEIKFKIFHSHECLANLVNYLVNFKDGFVCILSSHGFSLALVDKNFNKVLMSSRANVPDGKPIALYACFKYKRLVRRAYGPDLMITFFEHLNNFKKKKIFFLGGNSLIKSKIYSKINLLYPNVQVVGFDTRFIMTNDSDNSLINEINKKKPDIVFVGIGCPKQELWMYKNHKKINSLLIGVGAAFDFFAETKKQAPKWVQHIYLEWLFRLVQEPRRLFMRYLKYNTIFVFHCCCMAIKFLCNKVCKK